MRLTQSGEDCYLFPKVITLHNDSDNDNNNININHTTTQHHKNLRHMPTKIVHQIIMVAEYITHNIPRHLHDVFHSPNVPKRMQNEQVAFENRKELGSRWGILINIFFWNRSTIRISIIIYDTRLKRN